MQKLTPDEYAPAWLAQCRRIIKKGGTLEKKVRSLLHPINKWGCFELLVCIVNFTWNGVFENHMHQAKVKQLDSTRLPSAARKV
jgi:hypothetical protein